MGSEQVASPSLEAFVNELMKRAKERGYNPTIFSGMRRQYGTLQAIEVLVQSGEIQSGFMRLKKLGLLEWSSSPPWSDFPPSSPDLRATAPNGVCDRFDEFHRTRCPFLAKL